MEDGVLMGRLGVSWKRANAMHGNVTMQSLTTPLHLDLQLCPHIPPNTWGKHHAILGIESTS